MPRVTILLTCYNHFEYLPECLDGVLAQTFTDYEILALDDGSTDGTREWLKEREAEGKLRCIFNEQNLGTYATLNVGLGKAKGEFIAVLNDDDLWAGAKLERQIAMFDSNERLGLVHTSGWFIDGQGNKVEGEPLGFAFPSTRTGEILHDLMHHNQIITSSALVKRECFEKLGPFDPSYYGCGDWNMWLRVAREYHIGFVDEPLTFYRVHETNASRNIEKMLDDDYRVREWITTWDQIPLRKFEHQTELLHAFTHNWACLGTIRTWRGNAKGGRQAYLRSIRLMPYRIKSYLRWIATFLPRETFRKLM
jgi:glycosyltransferase involved in cell wall biosynthesis